MRDVWHHTHDDWVWAYRHIYYSRTMIRLCASSSFYVVQWTTNVRTHSLTRSFIHCNTRTHCVLKLLFLFYSSQSLYATHIYISRWGRCCWSMWEHWALWWAHSTHTHTSLMPHIFLFRHFAIIIAWPEFNFRLLISFAAMLMMKMMMKWTTWSNST